ncbi:F-actin-capping protein subunit alpha [Cystobasidiomycetes sp. EMM_F5]
MSGSKAELSGHIQINVHFFEQGNVQLATNVKPSLSLPDSITVASSPQDIAKAVIKVISKAEEEYQLELNEAYRELSEKTFRSLRRALPITRQKMDWAKVANYKVGKDLTSVKAP